LIGELPSNVIASYQGIVRHEDVCTVLASHDLFFLPTRGENFGHAILEALSAGLPVLISDQTPWGNLEREGAGWALSLDNTKRFAEKVDQVAAMQEPEHAETRARALRFAQRATEESLVVENNRRLFLVAIGRERAGGRLRSEHNAAK
jgi:glycosyltransferase involved in cell wall biosynthesis